MAVHSSCTLDTTYKNAQDNSTTDNNGLVKNFFNLYMYNYNQNARARYLFTFFYTFFKEYERQESVIHCVKTV